jgi:predicted phage terminase large subunit-like protein
MTLRTELQDRLKQADSPLKAGAAYIDWTPSPKQIDFLNSEELEVLYGGAARGGKTVALLMAAAQYVDRPDYHALLLRRTSPMLKKAEGLVDLANKFFRGKGPVYNTTDKIWRFPSGATIEFGYCEHILDVEQYQGAAYQYIGLDEVTHFAEYQYKYLFSRLTRPESSDIPIRMRAATNPPIQTEATRSQTLHLWPRDRFIPPEDDDPKAMRDYAEMMKNESRRFIPALPDDNPHIDLDAYLEALARLGDVEYAQLRHGNWWVSQPGTFFKRSWFERIEGTPGPNIRRVRYWDFAATSPKAGEDPDYTVGLLLARSTPTLYVVEDIVRFREEPAEQERLFIQTSAGDGPSVAVKWEEEGGASGKIVTHNLAKLLAENDIYNGEGIRSTGDKATRAKPVAGAAKNGFIKLLPGNWNGAFLDELTAFPSGAHDDQVDALSGAFSAFSTESDASRFDNIYTGRVEM